MIDQQKLNDGTKDYELVRAHEDLPDGRINVALYESVPPDPDYQFTPSGKFLNGLENVPTMVPLKR